MESQGTRSRFYPITYIVARSKGALDWFTGIKLYNSNIGTSYGLEDHHIFPVSVLYKNGFKKKDSKDRKAVNDLANRAFLTKKANLRAADSLPSAYLPQVMSKYPTALGNQFVPADPKLWEVENYARFLAERRIQIAAAINKFIGSFLAPEAKEPIATELIKSTIQNGESDVVEFKSSLRWDYKKNAKNSELQLPIVKTLAGFMNAKGGTLVVGVGPSGDILGIENDYKTMEKHPNRDGFEQKIVSLISNHLGKQLVALVHVNFATIDGKDVCWIRVEPSTSPVYLENDDAVTFYARLGNTTHPMNPKEMTDYISIRWK